MIHELSLSSEATRDLVACLASIRDCREQQQKPRLVRGVIGAGVYRLWIDDGGSTLARICCESAADEARISEVAA